MPDLAQGYTADVVLLPGDSVRVGTVGQATVRSAYGAPAGTTTLTANTQTFGPYGVPAKLTITAVSGTATYAQPTFVPVSIDSSSGLTSPQGAVFPRILANNAPGRVLNDSSTTGAGTNDTAFGIICTVPGGLMREFSKVLVWSAVTSTTGGNNKSQFIKVGPASGNYATATQVSGWSLFNSQAFSPVSAMICADGVRNRQRSTPANAVTWLNGHSTDMVVTNIDTDLDWNIYSGFQFATANAGYTATERDHFVMLIP